MYKFDSLKVSMILFLSLQTEIKTGFVFLQNCDNCDSHYDIIGILEGVILEVDRILSQLQTPPLPPTSPYNINDYIGHYSLLGEKVQKHTDKNIQLYITSHQYYCTSNMCS